MSTALDALVLLIEKVSGNVIPERDLSRLEKITQARIGATKLANLDAYVAMLKKDQDGDEWRQRSEEHTSELQSR